MTPSGGAGTVLGVDYQARVVAWLSARALAGPAASAQLGWQPNSEIQSIWVETSDAVDDIRMVTAHDGSAFLQVKHAVQASRSESSPLAKTLHQFAAQRLDALDRLVLITSSASSSAITTHLGRVLDRIRHLRSSDPEAVCRTQAESLVFATVVAHLRREWGAETDRTDESQKITRLLSRVHVAIVDVAPSESAAIEADQLLRGLLLDPRLSGQAWVQLIDLANRTAILQAGMTATSIAGHLIDAGLQLGPRVDFRPDIDRLRSSTSLVIERLRRSGSVVGDEGTSVQIDRDFRLDLLAATDESLLITGDPGAGKSGAIAELIELLTFADVVAFSADSLAHMTVGKLSSEIGLRHSLSEVLANWRSDRPGYVVIDALDAGRGSPAQQALAELIRSVAQIRGRWKIVATVRRFDLRYNPTLKELFPVAGTDIAEPYRLAEFSRVRHFNIGTLTAGELAQLDAKAPLLSEKIRDAGPALRDLLTNPFSLRLFAELIVHGDPAERGTPITSRLQLLESYWEQRVFESPAHTYRRERVLRRISEEMIAHGVLTVDGAAFVDGASADDVTDLLQAGLLMEETTGPFGATRLLTFAHHVLFDYAVARLFLSGADLQSEAISNPNSLFLIRPSYQMYFEGLWWAQADRQDFWTLALTIAASPEVPAIAKIIAPAVAASLVASDRDLAPLLAALNDNREGAPAVLRHLVNALLTDEAGQAVSGDDLLLWATFTESLSRRLDVASAIVVRDMVRELLAAGAAQNGTAGIALGLASRRLLRWTWTGENRVDRFFTHFAVAGITSTYVFDATSSAELVRKMITPEHLAQYGYIEMPSLCENVLSLLSNDPDLVRDIYVAAFGHKEQSKEATSLTRGILNMSSNRRQDYEHSHYTLANHFPTFLEESPREALAALCGVYERHVSRYAYKNSTAQIVWEGGQFSFVDDYLFEGWSHDTGNEARMLKTFANWLLTQATPNGQHERFELTAETFRSHNAPASVWRVLLRSIPATVDLQIVAPLLCSPIFLASRGLSHEIGELISTRFSGLGAVERLEIEEAILGLDAVEATTSRARARLIGLVPAASLQTEVGRALWRESHKDDNVKIDRGPSVDEQERECEQVDEMLRYGIDTSIHANATIMTTAQPVKEFNEAQLNEIPHSNAVRDIWSHLWALWSHLQDPLVRRDASATLVSWSLNDLGQAVDVISRSKIRSSIDPDDIRRLVEVTAALLNERSDEPENLDDFDTGTVQSFGLPTRVIQASVALIQQGLDDGRLEELLRIAAFDKSPSVRLSVAGQIGRLQEVRPHLVAVTLEDMEAVEQSGGVLERLARTIGVVDWDRPGQLVSRISNLHTRATVLGARGEAARATCCQVATALFIHTGDASAQAFVQHLISQEDCGTSDLKGITEEFRGAFASHGSDCDARRNRAFLLAVQVVARASSRFAAAQSASVVEDEDQQDTEKLVRELAQIVDTIGNDVYFSSGAYPRPETEELDPDPALRIADYYRSSRELLIALPDVPFPSVVHHVLETLDYLLPADPAQVFRDMTDVILRGRAGGYEYDQMAASFVADSVSRFLVQHRHLLQTKPDLQTCLVRVLDTFVAVGWAEARMLTYRLDDVFR